MLLRVRQVKRGTHRGSDVDQSRPRPLVPVLLTRRPATSGAHKAPRNVGTELDRDTERDDKVDERDGVEVDAPEAHQPGDVEHGQRARECDDSAGTERVEEGGGDEEDGEKGEREDLEGDADDMGVLRRQGQRDNEHRIR